LLRTVNAAVAEGITTLATVHDSFGCLPSRAGRFRKIIREQFVRTYQENDVLAQVLEQARKDLGENAKGLLDQPPKYGDLDIEQLLGAEYGVA
jgi:DNA-directed RNA polymerase